MGNALDNLMQLVDEVREARRKAVALDAILALVNDRGGVEELLLLSNGTIREMAAKISAEVNRLAREAGAVP